MGKHRGTHRAKDEKLERLQLGSRYVGLDLGQFYWECLKLAAAAEELSETDILRRIIRSWSNTLPPAIQEKARADTVQVEAWKAQELRARKDARLQAKQARLNARRAKLHEKGSPELPGPFLRRREGISASN
jgi:hypothetical protein